MFKKKYSVIHQACLPLLFYLNYDSWNFQLYKYLVSCRLLSILFVENVVISESKFEKIIFELFNFV